MSRQTSLQARSQVLLPDWHCTFSWRSFGRRAALAALFTQAAFLAGHADALEGSLIHRGAYVQRRVLCREFGALPPNVGTVPPASPGAVTTRARVAQKTSASACQHCHKHINPTGFAYESFDSLGRFRTEDNGEPVDATGTAGAARALGGLAGRRQHFVDPGRQRPDDRLL